MPYEVVGSSASLLIGLPRATHLCVAAQSPTVINSSVSTRGQTHASIIKCSRCPVKRDILETNVRRRDEPPVLHPCLTRPPATVFSFYKLLRAAGPPPRAAFVARPGTPTRKSAVAAATRSRAIFLRGYKYTSASLPPTPSSGHHEVLFDSLHPRVRPSWTWRPHTFFSLQSLLFCFVV